MIIDLHCGPTRHGWLTWLPHDEYVGRSLELYGEFSEAETCVFQQLIKGDDFVVEVGANIGAHTVSLAQMASKVRVYEPQKFLYKLLNDNVGMMGNVEIVNAAVGNAEGTILLPNLDYSKQGNYGGLGVVGWRERLSANLTYEVGMTKLDHEPVDRMTFLKVDVEGFELEVLKGARDTISRRMPVLYMENDRPEKSGELIDYVRGLGYDLWWHCAPLFNDSNYRGNHEDVFPGIVSVNMVGLPPGWKCVKGVHVDDEKLPLGIELAEEYILPTFVRED